MQETSTFQIICKKINLSQTIKCNSFDNLLKQIDKVRQEKNLQKAEIINPRIKDQSSFQKYKNKKQLTLKVEEKVEKKNQDQIKFKQEKILKKNLNALERVAEDLKKRGIVERPFIFIKEDESINDGTIGNSFSEHFSGLLYLLRVIPELRRFCEEQDEKNLINDTCDKLLIKQFLDALSKVDGRVSTSIHCPLDWAASLLIYCEEYFDFPYPIFPFDQLLHRIFNTFINSLQNGKVRQMNNKNKQQRFPQQSYNLDEIFHNQGRMAFDKVFKLVGVETRLEDKQQQKSNERGTFSMKDKQKQKIKLIQKSKYTYCLPCDFSKSPPHFYEQRLFDGARKFMEKTYNLLKRKNKEIMEFQYENNMDFNREDYFATQKQVSINFIPKYLFVPISRVGKDKKQPHIFSDILKLSDKKKSKQKVPIHEFIDLHPLCSEQLKNKLRRGHYWRDTWFENLSKMDQFQIYIKQNNILQPTKQDYYKFFDQFLLDQSSNIEEQKNLYHQFYFGGNQDCEGTSDYRLIGGIYHKGDYYHNLRVDHLKQPKRSKTISNIKNSIFSILRVRRIYEQPNDENNALSQSSEQDEENNGLVEDLKQFERKQEEIEEDFERKNNFIENTMINQFLKDDSTPENIEEYEHNCRGQFQTLVYNKNKQWLKFQDPFQVYQKSKEKFEDSCLSKTTIDEAISQDKWGEGDWTPCLLLYKQISFPKLID